LLPLGFAGSPSSPLQSCAAAGSFWVLGVTRYA
jgi:hypothetical protein